MFCKHILQSKKGFSTVELLIAMAILVISLSAIIMVSFGTQSILVDSQTNAEALTLAQEYLEKEQALARKDFKLVNPATDTEDIYNIKVDVESPADKYFLSKKVTATVSWPDQYKRGLNVQLSAFVTNFENANGGDTCNSILSGNWSSPSIGSFFIGNTNPASVDAKLSVDAYKQKLYAAISSANTNSAPTLFVYSLANPTNPAFISAIDTAFGIMAGLNDIHATDGYLYAAKATGPASGQLQIFDISGSIPAQVGFDFKIDATSSSPAVTGTGGQAVGSSIFYKDGYVYMGLTKTASGPEFHIVDVHSPSNPFEVGSYAIGSTINAIYVKGKFAYLVHPDTAGLPEQLTILDLTNPTAPVRVGGFYSAGGLGGNGKNLYTVGDALYLGRTATNLAGPADSIPEFFVLDNSNPASLPSLGSLALASSGDSINGLLVRDYLAYLVTNNQLQILRVDNPASITLYASPLALPSAGGTSLDCEGNYIYAGSVDAADKANLSVIYTP